MKIVKTNQIAGYKSEMVLKTDKGKTIKNFLSVSGVDFETAEQNCLKRMDYFCSRVINYFLDGKDYWIEKHIQDKIKDEKITKKDFEKIKTKLEPRIKKIKKSIEVISLNI